MINSVSSATLVRSLSLDRLQDVNKHKKEIDHKGAEKMLRGVDLEKIDKQELDKLVDRINTSIASIAHDVQLQVDRDHNRVLFKIVDTATKELIRQIPQEEVLEMNDKLAELQGIIFEQEA